MKHVLSVSRSAENATEAISLAHYSVLHALKAMCHTDALLWGARKIASMALPAARERHAKNVWHIALRGEIGLESSKNRFFFA